MALNPRILIVTALVLIAALIRFVDDGLVNVAPVGAIALFGGACFRSRRAALGVTLATMLLSDSMLYLTRYRDWTDDRMVPTLFVYLAFATVVMVGRLLKDRRSVGTIALASVAGSMSFFLISNLAAWAFYPDYSKDFSGLLQCYLAAIPFYRGQSALLNTLLGDLLFNGLLFGSYALLEQRVAALRPESSPVVG